MWNEIATWQQQLNLRPDFSAKTVALYQGFTPVIDSAHLKVDRRCAGPFHQRKQCIEAWQGIQSFMSKKEPDLLFKHFLVVVHTMHV